MAINFPGPYQMRIYYDTTPAGLPSLQHVQQFNFDCDPDPDPGDLFADIYMKRWVGTPVDADSVLNAYKAVMRNLMSSTQCTLTHAEIWKYDDVTHLATYISTASINQAGLFVASGVPGQESIYSFRTLEGGVMYLKLLETPFTGNSRESHADMTTNQQNYVDWVTADASSYMYAKDTSRPYVFLRHSPGTNEALMKRRFRP